MKINFALPDSVKGKATLRLSIAGATMRSLAVGINGTEVGNIKDMIDNGAIRRDGIRGYWLERSIPFDAALLKQGNNILSLTIPQGSTTSGVEYDYLRLELAPSALD